LLSVTDKWLEKAHNQPLEFLATAGLIGLLSYLAVFAAVFWRLTRSRAKEPALFVSLGALFIAYFVQNFFLFDTPSTLVYLAVVLGLVSSLALNKEVYPNIKSKRLKLLQALGLLVIGLLVVSFPWTTWQPWRAAKLGGAVLQRQLQGNGEQIFSLYQKGFALNTYVSEKLLREGQLYITGLLNARQISPDHPLIEFFIKEHQKYLAAHPLSFRRYLGLGFIYLGAARVDPSFYPKAKEAFQKAQELAPRRPDAALALAEIYSGQGDPEGALNQIEAALELNPDYSRALWIKAQFLAASGKKDLALEVIRQVSVRSLQWRQVYTLRNLDYQVWQELKEFFESKPERFPSQVDYNLTLAVIYQRLGEPQKAQELAQKALNLKPAWQYSEIQLIEQMLRLKPEK
jgi:tetratricopeptide (TPR) repeat protein